jgi:hypothetical protein
MSTAGVAMPALRFAEMLGWRIAALVMMRPFVWQGLGFAGRPGVCLSAGRERWAEISR